MANQYRNALQDAQAELQPRLDKHSIEVDGNERMIVWREVVHGVPAGTSKTECIRLLKQFIKAAEKAEFKERQAAML